MRAREDLAGEVAERFARGESYREIMVAMGISKSYVYDLRADPSGANAKARKSKGRCVDCGTAIRSDGPSRNPQLRCQPCYRADLSANARWTRENIIEAVLRWTELYGQPTAGAWNMGQASTANRARFKAGEYPHLTEVVRRFGSWAAAMEAAGLKAKYPLAGKPRNVVCAEDYAQALQMREEGVSYREIGRRFDISAQAAQQRVQKAKGKAGGVMAASLGAVTVLEREIARFRDRRERALENAQEAGEEQAKLEAALAALQNGKPK